MSVRQLCFTVDLDRDVNDATVGSPAAISIDRGSGTSPRFSSSERGTQVLLDLLDDLGMRATFFAEARTLRETKVGRTLSGHEVAIHGLDHEDMTGTRTGVYLSNGDLRRIVEGSMEVIRDETGRSPVGFRSPYMDPNVAMLDFLHEYGVRYDSSRYVDVSDVVKPYPSGSPMIIELPALKGKDSRGKSITSYLWPMHEGRRSPKDFIDFAENVNAGTCIIATHTWHMVETRAGGLMTQDEIVANYDSTRAVLSALLDSGFRPVEAREAASSTDSAP